MRYMLLVGTFFHVILFYVLSCNFVFEGRLFNMEAHSLAKHDLLLDECLGMLTADAICRLIKHGWGQRTPVGSGGEIGDKWCETDDVPRFEAL